MAVARNPRPSEMRWSGQSLDIAGLIQPLAETGELLREWLGGTAVQKSDHRHRRLLRAHHERPAGCAAEKRDERAPLHSITSSARASSLSGIWRPSAFAVLRLMINSSFVACMTGRSAGFSPLRMRPV